VAYIIGPACLVDANILSANTRSALASTSYSNDRPIDSIRYAELEALLASLPLITAKTRNNTLIPLRGVFEFARKDRRISDNPAALLQNAPV
jgi:hypothetical protein